MTGSVTRRAALGHIAGAAAAWAQSLSAPLPLPPALLPTAPVDDPLHFLRPGHPRLLVLDADIERLRLLIREHPLAKRIYLDFEKECDRLLSIPPVEYRLNAGRLQTQSRRALDRITTLALMYRISGRDPWLRRAVMEMNAVAAFRDWNPARFVETAELAYAFALGYDWLYSALSPDERASVRDALVSKALDQALPIYQRRTWWATERLSWNVACNSAMVMAALAVGDEAREKAADVFRAALESVPRGLMSWAADGGWPEGMFFGEYAMRYACLLFGCLGTAMGTDYGLSQFHGIERAGRFRLYNIGPSGRAFNYADGPEDPGFAPEMFWLAKHFGSPAYSWSEQRQLEHRLSADAMDLAWFDRDARPPQGSQWPLDAVFHASGVATLRGSWEDPNAIFLAIKGGDNKAAHSHLDLGSFVLDAGGMRWTSDLGGDDYTASGVQRNGSYRVRTESHNTLLIEGESQDLRAEARITHEEISADLSWVQIDLSKASSKVRQWIRRAGLAQRQAVLMQDSLRSDQPVEVIWGMMTDAEISVGGPTANLRKNGWNLTAEIRSPRHAVFDVAAPASQAQSSKYRKLIVRMLEKVTELDLSIVLTPWRDGGGKPKITAQFPPI